MRSGQVATYYSTHYTIGWPTTLVYYIDGQPQVILFYKDLGVTCDTNDQKNAHMV